MLGGKREGKFEDIWWRGGEWQRVFGVRDEDKDRNWSRGKEEGFCLMHNVTK